MSSRTKNLKHFPDAALAPYGVDVQHPDEFLCEHLSLSRELFCRAVRKIRLRLKNPPYTPDQYLETLTRQGLVGTVAELRRFVGLL